MVAHIMADFFKVSIGDAFTLPARLRPLLHTIGKGKMHKVDCLIAIKKALVFTTPKLSAVFTGSGTIRKPSMSAITDTKK